MGEQQAAPGEVMPAVVASTETTGPQKAVNEPAPDLHRVSLWRPRISRHDWVLTGIYAGSIVVLGLLAGFVWNLVTPLQSVTVASDGTATMTNTAAVQNFSPDAAFVMIGLVLGLILGILAWQWFRRAGWPVVLIAVIGASLCALVAVCSAAVVGPSGFDTRLANAAPGETVAFDLALTSPTTWVVWPFAAVIPVLIYSALTHDTDEPRAEADDSRAGAGRDEPRAHAGQQQEQESDGGRRSRWAEEGRTGSGHRLLRFSHGHRVAAPADDEEPQP
ncbi:hypothetical protein [uncultured Propionibacterium sp.]|uniref:hypothetical protein n=1 Tax=uncultured Propionibacterium sp. TaxID=218066 RepID=UPI0029304D09|nr:hypothetical protein [uncultured Propionibacterium sp.]